MTAPGKDLAQWLFASLRSGLVVIDSDRAMAALSPEAAAILGCDERPAEAQLGRPAEDVLEAQPGVLSLLIEALEGREHPSRAELQLAPTSAGGETATIGFTLVTVRDTARHVRGAAMLFRDLTPFERMDEQERLRDRLAALGQMAAGLAHEIRNPLASMEVLAGLLKRRLGERPDELSLVEELLGELHGLAATVTASLEFVRPKALERRPCSPAGLLAEALNTARARLPFEGRVELDCPPGLSGPPIDPDQMREVLVNLLINALQAMAGCERPGGHRLDLRAAPDAPGGGLLLSIADTGPGVPSELRERIFYPFFTTRHEGSGVGLAEAQKIVASHGGSIELREAPEGGALFHIHLPASVPG